MDLINQIENLRKQYENDKQVLNSELIQYINSKNNIQYPELVKDIIQQLNKQKFVDKLKKLM